jgi:hypothetical protein
LFQRVNNRGNVLIVSYVLIWPEYPPGVAYQVVLECRKVGILDRHVFTGGHGEQLALLISNFGFGFKYFSASISHQFGFDQQFSAGNGGTLETNGHLGAEAEFFCSHGASPHHDFVQQSGEDAAVNHSFESGVFGAGREAGAHNLAIGFELLAQAERIIFTADETRFGVRQLTHVAMRRPSASWRKGKSTGS